MHSMKPSLFVISVLFVYNLFGQASGVDSLKLANTQLDSMVFSMLKEYEEEGADYLILRTYDSVNPLMSTCRIMHQPDSCTFQFELFIDDTYSIDYAYVGNIASRQPDHRTCIDELGTIYRHLKIGEQRFSSEPAPLSFREHRFTLFGKFNGAYLLEHFERDFVSAYQPGALHYVICSYFGAVCTYH